MAVSKPQALDVHRQNHASPSPSLTISPGDDPSSIESLGFSSTCGDWLSLMPPRVLPVVVLQVVSEGYLDVQRNFIRMMERNAALTRDNIYLVCLDTPSISFMASIGIRCVPVTELLMLDGQKDIWKLRVQVVGCLLEAGYDVLLSDSDAVWLSDPMADFNSPGNIVASRGSFPEELGESWGATMCMGFVLFRSAGPGMATYQKVMERIVAETSDDQIALNVAAKELGIVWDDNSDMRYENSTEIGRGVIRDLEGRDFVVILLPHDQYTRRCELDPITRYTVVAHCYYEKDRSSRYKEGWMKDARIWLISEDEESRH